MNDHLTLAEATKFAADLIDQFPSVRNVGDAFIGTAASVLMAYPRTVAVEITHPLNGLASETEFLSIAKIIAWLEPKTNAIRRDIERENRVEFQMKDETDVGIKNKSHWITYKEFREHCERNKLPLRPVGAFEKGGYLGPSE